MGTKPTNLHVAFFPLMAAGHMIPILDIAKLLASHNVKTTIITTPLNEPTFSKPLMKHKNVGVPINIEVIPFPCEEVGLPLGVENCEQLLPSMDWCTKFTQALDLFQEPLEQVIEKCKPDCLVSDVFLPFTVDVTAKFDIPRLVFHGTSFFSLCVSHILNTCKPYKSVSSDDDEFIIPYLPNEIKLTRSQIPPETMEEEHQTWTKLLTRALEAEAKSYGVIVNSFYELEPDYAHHYKKVLGRRAWHIGPVSLCNKDNVESIAQRGKDSSINQHDCLKWLDSKTSNSVIYICFGSLSMISASQLHEIAIALEESGLNFIWVVRQTKEENDQEEWLPDGFEERIKGKGLLIRGWAPQVVILDHEAIGGFVTHCGWNSILEGIASGVPMVTWPLFAEQFFNEKLVTEILKIGIGVGAKKWERIGVDARVKWKGIKETMERLMVSEDGSEMRNRAVKLKEMASTVVEIGGSSYSDLDSFIHDLTNYHA